MKSNLSKRLIVAAIGIPCLTAIIYFGGFLLYAFCLIVAVLGSWELMAMLLGKNIEIGKKLTTILIFILVSMFYFFDKGNITLLLFFVLFFLTSVFIIIETGISDYTSRLAKTFLVVIYPGFFISFAMLIHREFTPLGWIILLFIFVNTWIADTFAYGFGSWLGNHKLAPKVSPKKTWIGFIAAFPGGLIAALFAYPLLKNEWSLLVIIVASIMATFFGQLGDLVESAIKRDCGVKDSSNIIPGHGGVLDRFDSLLFAIPAVYFTLSFFK